MDIRQNPINPSAAAAPPQRVDPPPSAGPAAFSAVAPSLPQPLPSVVAISEGARSLALRAADSRPNAEQDDDADMAAAQLELMLGLLKVYTPPPPPTPQELGRSVAAAAAAQRDAVEAELDRVAERAGQLGDAEPAAATNGVPEPGEPAEPADSESMTDISPAAAADTAATASAAATPVVPAEPAAPVADSRASQRYGALGTDPAGSNVSLRA